MHALDVSPLPITRIKDSSKVMPLATTNPIYFVQNYFETQLLLDVFVYTHFVKIGSIVCRLSPGTNWVREKRMEEKSLTKYGANLFIAIHIASLHRLTLCLHFSDCTMCSELFSWSNFEWNERKKKERGQFEWWGMWIQ